MNTKNSANWKDLEGLRKRKEILDELWRSKLAFLEDFDDGEKEKSVIMEEKSGRIHKNLEDVNEDRRQ